MSLIFLGRGMMSGGPLSFCCGLGGVTRIRLHRPNVFGAVRFSGSPFGALLIGRLRISRPDRIVHFVRLAFRGRPLPPTPQPFSEFRAPCRGRRPMQREAEARESFMFRAESRLDRSGDAGDRLPGWNRAAAGPGRWGRCAQHRVPDAECLGRSTEDAASIIGRQRLNDPPHPLPPPEMIEHGRHVMGLVVEQPGELL